MAIEQALLLKGFVLAHNPPAEILQAAEAVVEALNVRVTGDAKIEIPNFIPIPVRDDEPSEPQAEVPTTVEPPVPPEPPEKKRHNWSPEAKAAAAERMRARMAAKKAAKEGSAPQTIETPAKPFSPVPFDKLISDHNEYAGKREPGQPLTDEDWPDIRARLAKNPDRRSIASDYEVELEDLDFFIASCQRREDRGGNFSAPMHLGA